MFMMAVGHSDDPDSSEAIQEILAQCQEQLNGETPQAGIVFAALGFDYRLILQEILAVYPGLVLVGCSTSGEISSRMGYQQDSVSLNLFVSDEVTFHASAGRNLSTSPIEITQATYHHLLNQCQSEPRLCLIFPEARDAVCSEVVDALTPIHQGLPILGGVAGGVADTLETYQFYQDEVLSDAVPMLIMAGNLKVSHGYASGWNPLGKTGHITKASGNTIYEIDDQPALNFYHHYLSDFSPDNAYPLAVFPPGEDQYLIRASLKHDPECGHLFAGGYVPEHSKVQITSAERTDIISATQESFSQAMSKYAGQAPAAVLFFTCAWRAWVLGMETHQEFETVQNHPNMPLPCSGFYTFGEISPLREGGAPFAHNTTFITLLLGTD